jgi:hypothetical protein
VGSTPGDDTAGPVDAIDCVGSGSTVFEGPGVEPAGSVGVVLPVGAEPVSVGAVLVPEGTVFITSVDDAVTPGAVLGSVSSGDEHAAAHVANMLHTSTRQAVCAAVIDLP